MTGADAEQTVEATGLPGWTRVRDEVAPALRRDFPGVIVDADERVITSTIPNVRWRGARLTVIGMEKRTAGMLVDAIRRELERSPYLRFQVSSRELTAGEVAQVAEHRAVRGGARADARS